MSPKQSVTISIPTNLDSSDRIKLGEAVIRKIVSRTKKGVDKDGRAFRPYSKSYKESLDFRLGGKSSTPNLTLSGEMLNDIELLNHGRGFIVVGFRDQESNDKAFFAKDPRNKSRAFLGVTALELRQAISEVTSPSSTTTDVDRGLVSSLVRRLIGA